MSEREAAGGPGEALFTAPMRRPEWGSLWYEAHYYLGALLLGAAGAFAFAWAMEKYYISLPPRWPIYVFAAAVMAGLGIVSWAATYYPIRVTVQPGAIRFKMLIGERTIALSGAAKARAVEIEEVKKTLMSPRFRNLTPGLSGAVMLETGEGRPWIFSLDDPEAFLRAVDAARREV